MVAVCLLTVASLATAQTAIGRWRDCPDYSKVMRVALAGGRVYAAAQNGLFYFDTEDNTVSTLSKSSGLHDVGISDIAFDSATHCLAVAYTNANLDLVIDGHVFNLSDIKRSDIPGDKSIRRVRFHGGNAYLATGFGIVVVDIARREIKETYYLGPQGTRIAVSDIAFFGDSIYAATADGLRHAPISEPHLTVADRWVTDACTYSYHITTLEPSYTHLLVKAYTVDPAYSVLLAYANGRCESWYSGAVNNLRASAGGIVVATPSGVYRFGDDLQPTGEVTHYEWGELSANDACLSPEGDLWVGHLWDGLIRIGATSEDVYKPSSPYSGDNVFKLVPTSEGMLLCPGGHTTTYANTYLDANLLYARGTTWTTLDKSNGVLDNTYDLVDAAVNPLDPSETAVAVWGSGVAIIRNNQPQVLYNSENTGGALHPYIIGDYSTLLTSAVDYDRSGNLWVLNSHQPYALAMRDRSGNWTHFSTEALASVPEIDKLVCDSATGYKWFCGRSNIIYVHDGKNRMAKVNPNSGSKLATESVNALEQDQNGNLWVGTNKGIKGIYDGYRAFNNGGNGEYSPVTCSNITITNGEFAEYLMAYENVTAIAVDGANRKWVGTASGGLYLLSANGIEQLQHFTTTNSPLFSDKIVTLAIQPSTGELYIGSDRGLQVYRTTATLAGATPDANIHAFPNPVRPGYDGPIAIKGFTRNAIVHITDAAGHVLFTTTADGGQAIWNGRTLAGEPVASGIYYVFASDNEGGNTAVAKILIIR